MKAIGFSQYLPLSSPDALQDLHLPVPAAPQGHDLLVEVRAVSVNPVDTKVRGPKANGAQPEAPRVIGWDASGVVLALGPEATGFAVGDEVYYAGDLQRSGSNAQQQLVDARLVAHKPKNWSFAQAAAVPLTALTAWEGLFEGMGIPVPVHSAAPQSVIPHSGKKLLVIGGAGGVPSMVIQLARWAGLRVFATASRPESAAWVQKLGAELVLDHQQDMPAQLKSAGENTVDYIFCTGHTEQHWQAIGQLLWPQGTVVLIDGAKDVPLEAFKSKSLRVVWEFMFSRSMFQTNDMHEQGRILQQVAALVEAGLVTSPVTEHLQPINAHNLRRAHALVESGRMVGKVVLSGW